MNPRKVKNKTEKNLEIIQKSQEDLVNLENEFDNENEKKYNQVKLLIQRWVNSKTLLAKTVWVERMTIHRWFNKIQLEFAETASSMNKETEVWKMIEQLDMCFYEIWKEIINSNLSENRKISAIVSALQPLKLKWDVLWLFKTDPFTWKPLDVSNVYQINNNVYNYFASLMWWTPEEVEKALKEWKTLPVWKSIEELSWIKPI